MRIKLEPAPNPLELREFMLINSFTKKMVAEFLGVSLATVKNWRQNTDGMPLTAWAGVRILALGKGWGYSQNRYFPPVPTANALRVLMARKHLTAQGVADLVGVGLRQVWRWKSGQSPMAVHTWRYLLYATAGRENVIDVEETP